MGNGKIDIAKYPPVIVVVGHVDHGKTTLLDAIRKTDLARQEHGGITQKIGASTIEFKHDGALRKITFIDTPGHAVFTDMRGRGTQVADIGLLIVSLTEGVKPQTQESIQLLKAASIPYIVVLTKADLPNIKDKVIQQLLKEEVMLEGYGGDIPFIEVSATSGQNITELLDLILLSFDLNPFDKTKIDPSLPLLAYVIEAKLDSRIGPRATLIIKNGTLSLRDNLVSKDTPAKVRQLLDDKAEQISQATIGQAVEVVGFEKVPIVGEAVYKKEEYDKKVESVTQERAEPKPLTASDFLSQSDKQNLALILSADTQGSLEAIVNALPEDIVYILRKTGDITEGDVLMAKSTGAIILGFNIKIKPAVIKLAQTEKILMKNYTLIYELIDEVHDVIEGKKLQGMEEELGKAKILATFPYEKDLVLGVKILDGRVAKGDKVRLIHGEEARGEASLISLRQGKNPTSKVEQGAEAGLILNTPLDITIGDMLIFYR